MKQIKGMKQNYLQPNTLVKGSVDIFDGYLFKDSLK